MFVSSAWLDGSQGKHRSSVIESWVEAFGDGLPAELHRVMLVENERGWAILKVFVSYDDFASHDSRHSYEKRTEMPPRGGMRLRGSDLHEVVLNIPAGRSSYHSNVAVTEPPGSVAALSFVWLEWSGESLEKLKKLLIEAVRAQVPPGLQRVMLLENDHGWVAMKLFDSSEDMRADVEAFELDLAQAEVPPKALQMIEEYSVIFDGAQSPRPG